MVTEGCYGQGDIVTTFYFIQMRLSTLVLFLKPYKDFI